MQNSLKEPLKYYFIVDQFGEVTGTYEKYETALSHKQPTDELRYYNGFETIYNVNGKWGDA
jgi:hypothetical protein